MWTAEQIENWIRKYYTLANRPETVYNTDSGYKLRFRDGQTYEYLWLKPKREKCSDPADIHEVYINGQLVQRIKRTFSGEVTT